MILAVLSIVAGYLGIPDFLGPMFETGAGGAAHEGGAAIGIMVVATFMGFSESPAPIMSTCSTPRYRIDSLDNGSRCIEPPE